MHMKIQKFKLIREKKKKEGEAEFKKETRNSEFTCLDYSL